jgi:rhodanese-related sulfurtransferase
MACGWLAEAGVKVINVDGGFSAWESAGLPVEK